MILSTTADGCMLLWEPPPPVEPVSLSVEVSVPESDSANRSKGAKGPEEWRPPDESYWCQYATDWATIKSRWGLTVIEDELEALEEMMATCENGVDLVVTGDSEETPEPTPTPVCLSLLWRLLRGPESRVYLGSSGQGRGFLICASHRGY